MAKPETGPLAQYNSLKDEHLAGYFNNKSKWRHLVKAGLITRSGEVVPEPVYRLKMARKEHKRHVRDMLAQAIVHKSLDLERKRQVDIRRKLEEIAKMEHVRRIKNERSRRGDEDLMPLLDPGAGTSSGIRRRKQRPNRIGGDAEEAEGDNEPEPSGLPPHPDTVQRRRLRRQFPHSEIDSKHLITLDSVALQEYANILEAMRRNESGRGGGSNLSSHRAGGGGSSQRRRRRSAENSSSPGRRLREGRSRSGRPKSAARPRAESRGEDDESDAADDRGEERKRRVGRLKLHRTEPAFDKQASYQSLCKVTLHYYGPALKIPHDGPGQEGQEVTVMQQHSGGNTLRVFFGLVKPGEDFTFVSRRHRGYPFSLSLYIDGVMDSRVSACCEYKHRTGVRLGSKTGHFGFVSVSEAAPCYRCQVEEQMKDGRSKKEKTGSQPVGRRRPKTEAKTEIPAQEDLASEKTIDRTASQEASQNCSDINVLPDNVAAQKVHRTPSDNDIRQDKTESIANQKPSVPEVSVLDSDADDNESFSSDFVTESGGKDGNRAASAASTTNSRPASRRSRSLTSKSSKASKRPMSASTASAVVEVGDGVGRASSAMSRSRQASAYEEDFQDDDESQKDDEQGSDKDGSSRTRSSSASSGASSSQSRGKKASSDGEYEVTVQTSDKLGSGTDGKVLIQLVGTDATSEKLSLEGKDGKDLFERGNSDHFSVDAGKNLGEITAVKLYLREGGFNTSWLPESVTVKRGDRQWLFPAGRWIEKDSSDTLSAEDANDKSNEESVYKVTIRTSDQRSAGTDARVFATLIGQNRKSERFELRNDRIDCFECGQTDEFSVNFGANLGDIKAIELQTEGGGLTSSWLPQSVTVAHGDKQWRFQADRWIERNSSETLPVVPEGKEDSTENAEERTYSITVKTGDRMGAKTDGRVTLRLAGNLDTSKPLSLDKESQQDSDGVNLFDRGQINKFKVLADKELGDLKDAELLVEGGISTGWYVDTVTVEQQDGKRWVFHFDRWLQKSRQERCAASAKSDNESDDEAQHRRKRVSSEGNRSQESEEEDEEVVNFKIEGSPEHDTPEQQPQQKDHQQQQRIKDPEVSVHDAPDIEESPQKNSNSGDTRKDEIKRRGSFSSNSSFDNDSDDENRRNKSAGEKKEMKASSFSEESDSGSEDEAEATTSKAAASQEKKPTLLSDEEDEAEEAEDQRWKQLEEEARKRDEEEAARKRDEEKAQRQREEQLRREKEEQEERELRIEQEQKEKQAAQEKGLCDYKLRFVTDSVENAGTHAAVSITLCGDLGETDVRTFKNERGDKFQSGRTDEFLISSPDLGAISKIRLWTDAQYEQDNWLLSHVEVEDLQRNVTHKFPGSTWFTRENNRYTLLAAIQEEGDSSDESKHEDSQPSSAGRSEAAAAAPTAATTATAGGEASLKGGAATTTTTEATTSTIGGASVADKPSNTASGTTTTPQLSDVASVSSKTDTESDEVSSSSVEESTEAESETSSGSETETPAEDDDSARQRQSRMRSGSIQPDDIGLPETRTGKVRELFLDDDKAVKVFDTKLTEEQFELFLKELSKPERAKAYDNVALRNCQLTDSQAIRVLEALAGYSSLIYLNFGNNNIGPRAASVIAERLSGWPNLENINLHGNAVGDDGIYALVKGLRTRFRSNSNVIQTIDLGATGMTDQGLQQLAGLMAENPPLAALELTASRGLSEAAWAGLGRALRANTQLESLMLDYCDLTDSALAALLDGLGQNRTLESLDLEGNRLTDRACDSIAQSASRNGLRTVSLENNGGVGDERIEQLETQLAQRSA